MGFFRTERHLLYPYAIRTARVPHIPETALLFAVSSGIEYGNVAKCMGGVVPRPSTAIGVIKTGLLRWKFRSGRCQPPKSGPRAVGYYDARIAAAATV
ncbi:hypothetical protein QTP88_004027 [Uroleucon formosanum]